MCLFRWELAAYPGIFNRYYWFYVGIPFNTSVVPTLFIEVAGEKNEKRQYYVSAVLT